MKVSIVIPVLDNLDLTKQCIESIWKNTELAAFELIIIDNGSQEETKKYLQSLNATLIRNDENQGFTKAINQGIEVSQGQYIFVLNNDTILYPDWLPRLTAAFDESVGAVGPVSNYVMGKQKVAVGRKDVLPEKIHQLVSLKKGETAETDLLIGFALMISRDAWKKVGKLDERFFAGSDDLDYSLRLRMAGYTLKIALDTFVYHVGMSTSHKVLNQAEQMFHDGNQAFFDKWSDELGVKIESHRQAFEVALGEDKRQISICTIVKNEGGLLENMIKVTSAFCDDYCVLDTGSTDDTVVDTRRLLLNNGFVRQFDWDGNFSNARNHALSFCRGEWILQLDADEVIPKEYATMMKQLIAQSDFDAFRFKIINFRESPFLVKNPKKDILTAIRMWRNSPEISYDGMIHETITDSAAALGYKIGEAPVPIIHYAYLKTSSRHFDTMKIATSKEPHRSNNWYFLGEEYIKKGEFEEAMRCFEQTLSLSSKKETYESKVQQMLDITKAKLNGLDISTFPKGVHEHFQFLLESEN